MEKRQASLESMEIKRNFWKNKRVLVTGHTGFKGAWLALWLQMLGAKVTAISLKPETKPNLFKLIRNNLNIKSYYLDLRNFNEVLKIVNRSKPEIVMHLAAEAIVSKSLKNPLKTFTSNIIGTANLLEALRSTKSIKAILVVTSDKVYKNTNRKKAFTENNILGGIDPYSASKSATEIIVSSYYNNFFKKRKIPLVTARGGNVLGGGDWGYNRLIPDIWRAIKNNNTLTVRNPRATRPWQHVLDVLNGYIIYTQKIFLSKKSFPESLNFGPSKLANYSVIKVINQVTRYFKKKVSIKKNIGEKFKEHQYLSLNPSLAKVRIKWKSKLSLSETIKWTVDWYKEYDKGVKIYSLSERQILDFMRRK